MVKIDLENQRICCYDANGSPLFLYAFEDYDGSEILVSRVKYTKEEIEAAVALAWEEGRECIRRLTALSDSPADPSRESLQADTSKILEEFAINLSVYMIRKMQMSYLHIEVQSHDRPDDWADSNEEGDEE